MSRTVPPCVGSNAYQWDLEHADHERIIGPCLSCAKAVTGCSACPLKDYCAADPSPGTIRGAIAWLEVSINGRKEASECRRCGNPTLTRHQNRYCSIACRRDYTWTYKDAAEQEERTRNIYNARTYMR